MKKVSILIVVYAIFAALTISIYSAATQTKFTINAAASKVEWIGRKVMGKHNGNVNFSSGTVVKEGDKLVSAEFTVDMTSLTVNDITDKDMNGKLLGHLKSDDFFSVEKHKTATFKLKSAKYKGKTNQDGVVEYKYEGVGSLTIKGITKDVKLSSIVFKEAKTGAEAYVFVNVDRTQYDIKYGSKNFFEGLGDKAIDNTFSLNMSIQLNK